MTVKLSELKQHFTEQWPKIPPQCWWYRKRSVQLLATEGWSKSCWVMVGCTNFSQEYIQSYKGVHFTWLSFVTSKFLQNEQMCFWNLHSTFETFNVNSYTQLISCWSHQHHSETNHKDLITHSCSHAQTPEAKFHHSTVNATQPNIRAFRLLLSSL